MFKIWHQLTKANKLVEIFIQIKFNQVLCTVVLEGGLEKRGDNCFHKTDHLHWHILCKKIRNLHKHENLQYWGKFPYV